MIERHYGYRLLTFCLLGPFLALLFLAHLHLLSSLYGFFSCSLLTLRSLPLLVHISTLQDSLHDYPCVHVLEVVIADLLIYAQLLGSDVRIVSKGYE